MHSFWNTFYCYRKTSVIFRRSKTIGLFLMTHYFLLGHWCFECELWPYECVLGAVSHPSLWIQWDKTAFWFQFITAHNAPDITLHTWTSEFTCEQVRTSDTFIFFHTSFFKLTHLAVAFKWSRIQYELLWD